jgi:hypothetical protein
MNNNEEDFFEEEDEEEDQNVGKRKTSSRVMSRTKSKSRKYQSKNIFTL